MKKEELEKLSTEELLKKQKTTKMAMGLLAGMLLVLLFLNIFLAYIGKSPNFITPIALSPILFVINGSLKGIKEELAKR